MEMKDYGFYRGVNLGGWFSQCDYSKERLDHFIEEKDMDVIAGWGLDHVRLPMDYNVLETADGELSEEGFGRIARIRRMHSAAIRFHSSITEASVTSFSSSKAIFSGSLKRAARPSHSL